MNFTTFATQDNRVGDDPSTEQMNYFYTLNDNSNSSSSTTNSSLSQRMYVSTDDSSYNELLTVIIYYCHHYLIHEYICIIINFRMCFLSHLYIIEIRWIVTF